MECTPPSKYRCEICDKTYSSRQNLWKHNSKFHKTNVNENVTNVTECNKNVTCTLCNKIFNNRQTKWRHSKTCTVNKTAEIKDTLKKEITKELTEHFSKILQAAKIHPKTLQKINKQINNNNTNNGTCPIKIANQF